jgi:hypothetical protein
MNDLDATSAGYEELASPRANGGKGWEPIGTLGRAFSGRLDGQGYEIRDLFIHRPDESYVGLFGAGRAGEIENVGVVNASVTGNHTVGGLVGDSFKTQVRNSYFSGNVTGSQAVGGLVGLNDISSVVNSYSAGSVSGDEYVGGLVGHNENTVRDSYSTSNVTGNMRVGGLVGQNSARVINSYSTGSVSGDEYVGGLVGQNMNTVSDSYSTSNVTGNTRVGGLVGQNSAFVSNSYSAGSVSGDEYVGGLVGYDHPMWPPTAWPTPVSNSFWDIETSGQTTSAGGTGKTTAEMKNMATFSEAGWNIVVVANPDTRNPDYIWNIVNGVTYPFLSWQRA